MTSQPDHPLHAAIEQPPVAVDSGSDERLAQLHSLYADLRAKSDAAAKELKVVTDAIKVELTSRDAEARRFTLVGEHGPALALTYSTRWTLDSKRMKAEHPELYVQFAKQSGSWSLRPATGGDA